MNLTRYLDAIDNEITKEKDLFRIQVHAGYRATIERYIANAGVLTLKDLWCILSLYSTEVPDVIPNEIDGVQIIYFTPQPRVTVATTTISFVPQPRFTMVIPTTLQFVPQPRVAIESITLEYVPQPRVIIQEMLHYVPQPRFTLENVEVPIIYVPQPRILGQQGIISFVPQPRYVNVTATMKTVFSGIVLGNLSIRPISIDFTTLYSEQFSSIGSDLPVKFPTNISGWMVFAIPATENVRLSWYQDVNNQGEIGGPASPVNMANFWPDPEIKEHNGVSYRLYVSKMRSEASGDGLYLIRDYVKK